MGRTPSAFLWLRVSLSLPHFWRTFLQIRNSYLTVFFFQYFKHSIPTEGLPLRSPLITLLRIPWKRWVISPSAVSLILKLRPPFSLFKPSSPNFSVFLEPIPFSLSSLSQISLSSLVRICFLTAFFQICFWSSLTTFSTFHTFVDGLPLAFSKVQTSGRDLGGLLSQGPPAPQSPLSLCPVFSDQLNYRQFHRSVVGIFHNGLPAKSSLSIVACRISTHRLLNTWPRTHHFLSTTD